MRTGPTPSRSLLTSTQYRAALAKLGLTQVGAAKLRPRAGGRSTASPKTPTAVILLRAMLDGLLTIEQVERISKGAKK
jgi:hypothetical protein